MQSVDQLMPFGSIVLFIFVVGCGRSHIQGDPEPAVSDGGVLDASLPRVGDDDAGTEVLDESPLTDGCFAVSAPRLIAPLSGSVVTGGRPIFEIQMVEGNFAYLQICSDRACEFPLQGVGLAGPRRPRQELPSGSVFWRARVSDRRNCSLWSETWQLNVPHRFAPVETISGLIPDFDGDGRGDLVATGDWDEPLGASEVLVRQSSQPDILALRSPRPLRGRYANSISAVGDLNGDGYGDLAISDVCVDCPTELEPIRILIHLGGPGGVSVEPMTMFVPGTRDPIIDIAGAGDLNRDGYADFAFVAGELIERRVLTIVYGAAQGWGTIDCSVENHPEHPFRDSRYRYSNVAGGADANGDGLMDLVFGSELWLGDGEGGFLASVALPSFHLAYAITTEFVGDLDGDGLSDIATHRPALDSVLVISGDSRWSDEGLFWASQGVSLRSPSPLRTTREFGASMRGVGDIDGDGFDDMVIGAPAENDRGVIHIFHGGGVSLEDFPVGAHANALRFGSTIARLGDTNGDGFADFAVGAPSTGASLMDTEVESTLIVFEGGSGAPDAYAGRTQHRGRSGLGARLAN